MTNHNSRYPTGSKKRINPNNILYYVRPSILLVTPCSIKIKLEMLVNLVIIRLKAQFWRILIFLVYVVHLVFLRKKWLYVQKLHAQHCHCAVSMLSRASALAKLHSPCTIEVLPKWTLLNHQQCHKCHFFSRNCHFLKNWALNYFFEASIYWPKSR